MHPQSINAVGEQERSPLLTYDASVEGCPFGESNDGGGISGNGDGLGALVLVTREPAVRPPGAVCPDAGADSSAPAGIARCRSSESSFSAARRNISHAFLGSG